MSEYKGYFINVPKFKNAIYSIKYYQQLEDSKNKKKNSPVIIIIILFFMLAGVLLSKEETSEPSVSYKIEQESVSKQTSNAEAWEHPLLAETIK